MLSKEFNIDMDSHLNLEQKAQSHALKQFIEESIYFEIAYFRWIDEDGWLEVKAKYFADIPLTTGFFLLPFIRNTMYKSLYGQGIARYPIEVVGMKFTKDLESLSVILGEKHYFLSDEKPSYLDIIAFAFFDCTLYGGIESKDVAIVKSFPNLVGFVNRMRAEHLPKF